MFELITSFFNIVLYKPMFGALVLFYNYIPGHDLGIAIILLTILIKTILYPLSVKATKSQMALQDLQPKMKQLQEKYKNDKEKLGRETLELYKTEKINPFSGLFLAFIQLPILIALYAVFQQSSLDPSIMKPFFLGIINLSTPNLWFAVAAGVLQFFQTKMVSSAPQKGNSGNDMAQAMQKQMLYVFPIITIIILWKLPSAIGLYWIVSSSVSVIQQYFILKKINKK